MVISKSRWNELGSARGISSVRSLTHSFGLVLDLWMAKNATISSEMEWNTSKREKNMNSLFVHRITKPAADKRIIIVAEVYHSKENSISVKNVAKNLNLLIFFGTFPESLPENRQLHEVWHKKYGKSLLMHNLFSFCGFINIFTRRWALLANRVELKRKCFNELKWKHEN